MTDKKGMVFIEQTHLRRQVVHEEPLKGSIASTGWAHGQAAKDAAGVSIDDENGLTGRIEDYRVGCLLANAIDGKEHLS